MHDELEMPHSGKNLHAGLDIGGGGVCVCLLLLSVR